MTGGQIAGRMSASSVPQLYIYARPLATGLGASLPVAIPSREVYHRTPSTGTHWQARPTGAMHPLETYLRDLREIRATGAAQREVSYGRAMK